MCPDPVGDVIDGQRPDAPNCPDFLFNQPMKRAEIGRRGKLATDCLKPRFRVLEERPWNATLVRMPLSAWQLAPRRFADRCGRAGLNCEEAHFLPRVVSMFEDIVTDNFAERHKRSSRGRRRARIRSSSNVRIPLSMFFQKYSACRLAAAFQAPAI